MDYSKLGQAAAETEDLTVERKTTKALPRAGVALVRLVDYIETGRHEAKNPTHKPSLKVMLTFELSHPDHMIDIDGKKVPDRITVRVNKTFSADKGRYIPLFKAMNRAGGGNFKHLVQMIGVPMLATIYHTVDGDKKYANLDVDKAWSFAEPIMKDPIAGTSTPVPIPELHGTPKVYLWEAEGMSDEDTLAMWESLYIEGTRTDQNNKEVSKNWIQETIQANIEWEGSTIQALTEESVTLEDEEIPDNSLASNDLPSLDD